MKRVFSLFLVLALLLAGCSSTAAPASTTAAAVHPVTEPTTQPATEPTLSAEEIFIQSLPEKLRQAYELGIVELAPLEDSGRSCTIEEAAAMLQNAFRLKMGTESWMLTHCITEENAAQEVTRGWLMTMMYAAHGETLEELQSEDYAANLRQLTDTTRGSFNYIADLLLRNAGRVHLKNKMYPNRGLFNNWDLPNAIVPAYVSYHNYGGAFTFVNDLKEFDGDSAIVSYALAQHDRTNGEKLMRMDEEGNLRFHEAMTVQDVAETALRYFNALEPPADMVAYEDVGAFDPAIITADLLSKSTSLPDASCEKLPQWHGVRMIDMSYSAQQEDFQVYEFEIQAIKDAGFNMIQLLCDFQRFHEPVREPGALNENRLKELDQVLAWCMERDIHLNIVCQHSEGWPSAFHWEALFKNLENAEPLAGTWQALARRYAQIPNHYLSFTLFRQPSTYNDTDYGNYFGIIIQAIRDVSPDRCIIADVGIVSAGETIAQYGVALSTPCTWPDDFLFDYFSAPSGENFMLQAQWPHTQKGKTVDADAALASAWENWKSPDEVAAVADQYGVGFMVNEWGPCRTYDHQLCFRQRFPAEVMEAYLTDMTRTMADRGYGWCYTNWHGFAGIACDLPLVTDVAYEQMDGAPLYIDQEMTALFQKINGVN